MSQDPATKPLEIVPGISHLYRRGARDYFRKVALESLRRIVGKRQLVESLNIIVKPDGPELAALARLFREAELEPIRRQEDRVNGKPFPASFPLFHDLSARSTLESEGQGMMLSALCMEFISEWETARKAPKTQFQTQVAVNLLLELFGRGTPANAITRDDAKRVCGGQVSSIQFGAVGKVDEDAGSAKGLKSG